MEESEFDSFDDYQSTDSDWYSAYDEEDMYEDGSFDYEDEFTIHTRNKDKSCI